MTALRVATIACFALSVSLVIVLHVVSDLDPIERRLSEYAVGEWGSLMTAVFLLVGVGLGLLGVMIAMTDGRAWTVCGLFLVAAGAGMVASGVFPTDPGATTAGEAIHSRASAAATILVVAASVWWSFRSRRANGWQGAFATMGAVLVPVSVVLHETTWSGISQRVLWLTLIAWCALAAWNIDDTVAVDSASDGAHA